MPWSLGRPAHPALLRAFGGAERAERCPIGSAKPNVGHSEQSAGLASLIKTALAVETGVIPPTISPSD